MTLGYFDQLAVSLETAVELLHLLFGHNYVVFATEEQYGDGSADLFEESQVVFCKEGEFHSLLDFLLEEV